MKYPPLVYCTNPVLSDRS